MTQLWEEKTLYSKIDFLLSEKETEYLQFNKARASINTYFRPDLIPTTESGNKGKFFGENIYEGTPPWALHVMATGFQGNLVSKAIDWISYKMRQFELRGIDQLDIWCQDIKDYMSDVYRRSNFYDVQPLFTVDGLSIGSPVMFGEEDLSTGRVIWKPSHYKYTFLFYNDNGELEGCIVKDESFTVRRIVEKFVSNGSPESRIAEIEKNFTADFVNCVKQGYWNEEYTIVRAVFKKDHPVWDGMQDKPDGEWISVYFQESPDNEDKGLRTEKYFSRPFVTWDYEKKPWEPCSRTPAFYAIWDALSLQQVHKNFIENTQLKNKPPRFALNEMKNRANFGVGKTTWIERDEFQYLPKPVDMIGDVQLSKELSGILQESVKRHFHLDLFQLFTNTAAERKQPLTATQIWKMAGEKATLLSPAIETHSTYLESVDARMMDIESRAGRGPFAPDVTANIADIILSASRSALKKNGKGFSVSLIPEFIGPLARAQSIQQAVDPIVSGLQTMAPVMSMFPGTERIIKPFKLIEKLAEATNFPLDVLQTEEDFNAIIEGINQQQEQAQQMQNAIALAKASKDVSGPVDDKSILAGIGKAASE